MIIHSEPNFFSNSGKLSLVPYTKDFGRITHFEVMTWQLCNLLRSTLNCLQGTLILLQRYEFYLYIKALYYLLCPLDSTALEYLSNFF